jgi:hypothetical protein
MRQHLNGQGNSDEWTPNQRDLDGYEGYLNEAGGDIATAPQGRQVSARWRQHLQPGSTLALITACFAY